MINFATSSSSLTSFQYGNASSIGNTEIPIERCLCPVGHTGLSCQVRKLWLMLQHNELLYVRNVWMVISCLHLMCAYRVNVITALLIVILSLGNVGYVLSTWSPVHLMIVTELPRKHNRLQLWAVLAVLCQRQIWFIVYVQSMQLFTDGLQVSRSLNNSSWPAEY